MALDRLTKIDGGGISTTSDYRVGVITATKFVGPIEGSITATDATFSGNVSIAGTLTYEDVINVDSVGIGTFREGIFLPDNKKLQFGNAAGSADLEIFHSSSENKTIIDNNTNDLDIASDVIRLKNSARSETLATFIGNGGVSLYYDNSIKLGTAGWGIQATGILKIADATDSSGATNHLALGASNDLKIFHDGSTNRIHGHTGYLDIYNSADLISITASNRIELSDNFIRLRSRDGSDVYMTGTVNSSVDLYFNGSKKFETTSTGAKIDSGQLHIQSASAITDDLDMLVIDGGSTGFSGGNDANTEYGIQFKGCSYSTGTGIQQRVGAQILMRKEGTWNGHNGGGNRCDTTIAFTNSTGKFTDGTLAQVDRLLLNSDGNVQIPNDTGKLQLGASQDLEIFHNGSHSYIKDAGTGSLLIQGNQVALQSTTGENMIIAQADGLVQLNYDHSKKFETTNSGVTVTGGVIVTGGVTASGFTLGDNQNIQFGASNDLRIFHNGNHSYIADIGTGDLRITGSAVHIQNAAQSENMIRCFENAQVELYYNNSRKFETTSAGVNILGITTTTQLAVTGVSTFTGMLNANGDMTITSPSPTINFTENNGDPDYRMFVNGGIFTLVDTTNNIDRFSVTSSRITLNDTVLVNDNILYIGDRLVHWTDDDTMIRFHDADKCRIELGGITSAFTGLKSTSGAPHAKWGINIATPQAALHINEGYNHQGILRVTNGNQGTGYYHQLEMSGTQNIFTLWKHFDGTNYYNTHAHGSTGHRWYISGDERLRIDSAGNVSIGSTADALRRVDIVGNSLLVRPNTTQYNSAAGIATAVNNSIIIRMPYGLNAASQSNAGARFGIQFTGGNNTADPTLNFDDDPLKSASIYAVSEDSLGYNRKVGLAFYTSAFDATQTERLRIASDGNVGIKSTAPRGKLDIQFDGAPNFITFGSDADNPKVEFFRHTGGAPSHYATEIQQVLGDLALSTAAIANLGGHSYTERLRITSAGRVGIGSDTPVAHLDVANYQNIETLRLRDRHYNKYLTIRGGGTPNRMVIDSYEGGGGGAGIDLASNGDTKVRIDSDGDVIIGTTSWQYKKPLNVQGSSGHILSLYNGDTGTYAADTMSGIEFKLLTGNTGNQFGSCEIRALKENGTNGNNARALSFYTGPNGGSPNERLRINSTGDIGINYSGTPNATLDIRTDRDPSNGVMCFLRNNTNDGNGALYGMDINGCGTWSCGMLDNSNNFSIVDGLGNSGTEYFRIDSSGRCIVGGGSHAGGSALVVKGGNQNTYSTIGMFSNHTNPSDNTLLSQIRFGANASAVGADIRVYADAAWGNNDYPTRMSFYTTPDGSNNRTERLQIDKDGRLGVGDFSSTSIASELHVRGSQPEIYLEHTGGYDLTLTTNDGMGQNGITVNGGFLSLAYNNKNIVMCRTGGNVGIGEDDPDGNQLLIRGASTFQTNKGHIMLTGDSATVGEGPQIVFSESGSTTSYAGGYVGFVRQGGNSVGDLVFGTRGTSGDANTVPTERLRITSGGLVNVMGGNLHVGQDGATANFTDSNNGNTKHIEIGATGGGDALLTTHASGYGIGYFGYEAGGDRLIIACDDGGGANKIDFVTNAGTSTGGGSDNLNGKLPKMRIKSGGGGVQIFVHESVNDFQPKHDVTALLIQNGIGGGDIGNTSEPTHIDWAWVDSNSNVTPQCRISGNVGNGGDPNSLELEGKGFLTFHCSDSNAASGDLDPPQRLRIAHNGTFTGSSSNNISDQRLKENIATITDPIAKIKALKGRTFTWKSEARMREGTHYGFVAQEVESVIPDLIVDDTGIRVFDKDDNLQPSNVITPPVGGGYAKSVDSDGVTPVLVEALKEALAKIETLEAKVAALEGS